MTAREAAIISVYTGVLCGPFSAMYKYITELTGYEMPDYMLSDLAFAKQLKELSKPDFIALCESVKE